MKITLAENSGFCPGVKNADNRITEILTKRQKNEEVYVIGRLIHNRIYNESLENQGVKFIELSDLKNIVERSTDKILNIVTRTHGIVKEDSVFLNELAKNNPNLIIHDMTCPFVKRIHKIAEESTSDDTCFLLFGSNDHPENLGTISYAKGEKYIFLTEDELMNFDFSNKTPILCSQTTQNTKIFKKNKKILEKLCTNALIYDTICSVTENRQNEAIELASKSDVMIVIGGRDSSNTRKLYEICRERCSNTQWIESLAELSTDFPDSAKSAGITAGASTPDGIITEVLKAMEEKNTDFGQMLEETFKTLLHTGETVTGIVFNVNDNEIKLDLGAKFTGVLTKEQVTDDPSAKLSEMFKVGDEINVFVIRVEDTKGIATVSKKRVDKDNSWVVIKAAYDNGDVIEGKVISTVKGGVIVSYENNNIFVPASQSGIPMSGDLSVLVGTTQKIKLIDFDESKKRALGSIKIILAAEKKAKEEAIWATLEVGQHFMGTVKNLTQYGAFVDIGGIDGMVHNTELSWKKIKHPSQVVSVGQEIDVFIKELDPEKKRISLGYKTQEMDSWFQFTQKFNEGDVVPAKIVSIMPFGAFAEVYDGVDGLIHISRISTERIENPADVLKVGDIVDVKITEIDDDNRKLALSIRALKEAELKAERDAQRAAEKAARDAERAEREAEAAAEAERLAQERADMAPYIVGSI